MRKRSINWLQLGCMIFMAALILFFFNACESRTSKGECIGLLDKEKPGLDYRVSKRNAVFMFALGPISVAYTLLTEIKCPR